MQPHTTRKRVCIQNHCLLGIYKESRQRRSTKKLETLVSCQSPTACSQNLTMSCLNSCSGNYSLGVLRNPCYIPLTSSFAPCSTNVSRGDVLCLPSSFQDHTWLMDNCQETCGELISCQPPNCEPSNYETSCCSSTVYCGPRPCPGTSFLPAASYISSSCLPGSYVSSSCRPQRLFTYGCRPVRWIPCGSQSLSVVLSSLRPLRPLFSGCRPLTHVFSPCRPSCFALGGQ